MKKNDPTLEKFICDYVESKDDFIAIHYRDPFSLQDSMARYKLQNRKLPKVKEWDEVKERMCSFWPGLSLKQVVKLIKSYSRAQLNCGTFFCVFRANNMEGVGDEIAKWIPEENWECVQ